jgi:hypothetical protein
LAGTTSEAWRIVLERSGMAVVRSSRSESRPLGCALNELLRGGNSIRDSAGAASDGEGSTNVLPSPPGAAGAGYGVVLGAGVTGVVIGVAVGIAGALVVIVEVTGAGL